MSDLKKIAAYAMKIAESMPNLEDVDWDLAGQKAEQRINAGTTALRQQEAAAAAARLEAATSPAVFTPGKTQVPVSARAKAMMGGAGDKIRAMGRVAKTPLGLAALGTAGALTAGGAYLYNQNQKAASLNEVALAKAAAAELYEDALSKIAFAESLWAEADNEFVKIASDNGVGDLVGIGDQMTSVGGVPAMGDPTTMPSGAMSPGALNAFVEQLRKQRAVGAQG